jgi:hypothetical protein
MSRIRTFQFLVAVSALLYIFWMLLPHVPRTFSPEVQQVLSNGGYGGQPWVTDSRFYISLGVTKLLASLGLVLFFSWGRWLFAAVAAIGLACVPFSGLSVGAPLDNLVGYLASLIDGAILALSFSSPFSEAMRRDE